MQLQRRFLAVDIRQDSNSAAIVGGLAAPAESWTTLSRAPRRREKIAGDAFTDSVRAAADGRADILALVDHNPTKLLARTRTDSLRLRQEADGLRFELDLPDTTLGRDVGELVKRNLIGGVSIGFDMSRSVSERGLDSDGTFWRILRKVYLHEISLVQAFAAYGKTNVELIRRRQWLSAIES